MKFFKELEKLIISVILTIGLITSSIIFFSCSTVQYIEHTKKPKCDFAIMLVKIKSQKGNSAFEIGRYVDKCYTELDKKD